MLYHQIPEFTGIQQHKDGALLPPSSAYDARNIDASDGSLRVAKGYERYFPEQLPGDDLILKLMIAREAEPAFYVVTANNIYAYSGGWSSIYSFDTPVTGSQIDYVQTQIGTDDYIIVATGERQMLKIRLSDNEVSPFGSGLYSFEGTITAYDALTVTLSGALDASAIRHALLDGMESGGIWYEVASAVGNTVTLKEEPDVPPVVGSAVTIRGGGSDASCNFIDMYYGRLFASGDPNAPCRLYWSAAIGGGRTIEDWLSAAGTEEASGGYVEVGDASGDAIIGMCVLSTQALIFKKYSVYRLYGERPGAYRVERVENYSMNMSNASVVIKYDTPHYLTADGIYFYDGTGVLPMNARVLNRFMASVRSVGNSKGLHCDNMLYFSCRTKDGSYDDSIIVYDAARESFMIRDGFLVADMAVSNNVIYLMNDKRYLYKFNAGADYDGVPISAYWDTQPTDLGVKYIKKQIKEIMFRGSQGRVILTVHCGATTFDQKNLFPDNDGFVWTKVSTDMSRLFQVRAENEAGSYFEITGGVDIGFLKEAVQKS